MYDGEPKLEEKFPQLFAFERPKYLDLQEYAQVRIVVMWSRDWKNNPELVLVPEVLQIFEKDLHYDKPFDRTKNHCWLDEHIRETGVEPLEQLLEGKDKTEGKAYEIVGTLWGKWYDVSSWEYPNSEYEFEWDVRSYTINPVHESWIKMWKEDDYGDCTGSDLRCGVCDICLARKNYDRT